MGIVVSLDAVGSDAHFLRKTVFALELRAAWRRQHRRAGGLRSLGPERAWAGALSRPWCAIATLERRLPDGRVLRTLLHLARDIAESIAAVAA